MTKLKKFKDNKIVITKEELREKVKTRGAPVPPGKAFKDFSKYTRKPKHKKKVEEES